MKPVALSPNRQNASADSCGETHIHCIYANSTNPLRNVPVRSANVQLARFDSGLQRTLETSFILLFPMLLGHKQ